MSISRANRITPRICFLVVGILVVACEVEGKEDIDLRKLSTPLPLKIEISSESDSILVGADLPLRIAVTNASSAPMRIPTAFEIWGGIHATSPKGERAMFLREWPVQFDGNRDETIVLSPGAWYGKEVSKTTKFSEAGNWTISWTLHVPRGTDDIPFETGVARSNELTVTVKSQK